MMLVARLLREPLLHFLAFGGLIFVLYTTVSPPAPPPADTIVIGPERIEQLAKGYQAVWQRPPTSDELNAIIDDAIREEVYYREGLALGLDRNDTVIRRRLRQKMEFLTNTGADVLEPDAGELEAYFAANEKAYRTKALIAFEQVFLGEVPSAETIARSLSALQSTSEGSATTVGERSLLPAQLGPSPPVAVDGVFGKGFFERLQRTSTGIWSGPVASGYGVHLVRILKSSPATTPPFEKLRDSVLRDWRAAKAVELRESTYAKLLKRYSVQVRRAVAASAGSP